MSETQEPGRTQVGGDHYVKRTIQPWDIIDEYSLGFYSGNALKYLLRYKDKGGVEDLKKARHYLDKLIEVEGGETPPAVAEVQLGDAHVRFVGRERSTQDDCDVCTHPRSYHKGPGEQPSCGKVACGCKGFH